MSTETILPRTPAVATNAELVPQRYPENTELDLARKLFRRLIEENDISPNDIDGLYSPPADRNDPDKQTNVFTHEELLDEFGIQPSVSSTLFAGGGTFGIMLHQAARAVGTGQAETILCMGTGKFPSPRLAGEYRERALQHEQFEFPYGTFIPGMYALAIKRHMYEYGTTVEDLAHVSVTSRKWALENPNAYMHDKGELTVEDVLSSRLIAEPFHKLHCSVPTEGGGAFLVTTAERARELSEQPAYILGFGEYHTHGNISQAKSYTRMGPATSGKRAFEMAGITPDDVDVAQIYDAFASNPIMYAEDLGLAEKGQGAKLFTEGHAAPGGDLPINTGGGLLSYGHCSTASGMSVLNEAITQAMDQAGKRQVEDAEIVLAHTYGGMMASHSTILLGREAPQ